MSDENEEVESDNYFGNMASMLEALVPPKEVIITDVNGKEHKLPGAIAARRQIKVFREFQEIIKNPDVSEKFNEDEEFSTVSIINTLMKVAFHDAVLTSLGTAFKEAFPDACNGDPLDEFALEEVVAALVPLLLRFVKRAGKTLAGIGQLTSAL